MAIKNRLLEIRLKLGYRKQKDFAEFLGINKTQYNRYENNKEQPTVEVLYKVALKLKCHMDDVIYIEEQEEK